MTKLYSFSKALVACALALAVVTMSADAAAMKKTKAKAYGVRGNVQYRVADGPWMAVHNGDEFDSQTTIKTTGPDAVVNLRIDHNSSYVRVMPNTSMKIENLTFVGGADGDSDTMLNVQVGTIVGSVQKLSRASHYEVRTPNGVAGIRGTDFAISVEPLPDGTYRVTFTTIQGEVIAAALVAGSDTPITKVLNTGDTWTVGSDVNPTVPEFMDFLKQALKDLNPQFTPGGLNVGTPTTVPIIIPISPVLPGANPTPTPILR